MAGDEESPSIFGSSLAPWWITTPERRRSYQPEGASGLRITRVPALSQGEGHAEEDTPDGQVPEFMHSHQVVRTLTRQIAKASAVDT